MSLHVMHILAPSRFDLKEKILKRMYTHTHNIKFCVYKTQERNVVARTVTTLTRFAQRERERERGEREGERQRERERYIYIYIYIYIERERERERKIQRDREREIERERKRDIYIYIYRERERERERERAKERERNGRPYGETDRRRDSERERERERERCQLISEQTNGLVEIIYCAGICTCLSKYLTRVFLSVRILDCAGHVYFCI